MQALWYALLAFMLAVYVILDGFDLGVGILHRFVARDDEERRVTLAAIGPVWDGNEVWLIAGGGVLVYAFPRAYAVAFSGFYLPLTMVLWLLMLRGVSIELRSKFEAPWRSLWDTMLVVSSFVLALVLGVALGNVVRGVSIDRSGFFRTPLFGHTGGSGALDAYTILVGLFAVVALAQHGALWLGVKTSGALLTRSVRIANVLWPIGAVLLVLATVATAWVQPRLFVALAARRWAWPLVVIAAAGFVGVPLALRRGRARVAFALSSAFLGGLLAATAAALFPYILRSTVDDGLSVTPHNAATPSRGLLLGLVWWVPALAIALGYFVHLYRSFGGKVRPDELHY